MIRSTRWSTPCSWCRRARKAARGVKYAIRIPANNSLERDVAELQPRPVGRPRQKPLVEYKGFLYQAASWTSARRVVAKVPVASCAVRWYFTAWLETDGDSGQAEPNDTYVEQLVASAQAAIDEGARLGFVDPKRVAVMGHSYGAFMTVNLLAPSTLFKAGIARSGAYNRTLTPFGFQNEERTYWQAPEVYFEMSPFSYADKIKAPLLLIHGAADDNTGTWPLQSERLFSAIKGNGGTVRFVVLPLEAHGYAARESVLHMLWEMSNWLETYVKSPHAAAPAAAAVATLTSRPCGRRSHR